ncbi:hypothetical protein FXB41_39055 [Bradyrhizobium canariense]|uniref:hypothetical protein n=1 Tax=Bradyrhizobium canariense TaxID=255045 RepID=UPI001CA4BF0D|nr:hypothetical protein [Bradyrhizobium canariense]MBW5440554.1 hypothetical protein [Bradyrhizobium canariense]
MSDTLGLQLREDRFSDPAPGKHLSEAAHLCCSTTTELCTVNAAEFIENDPPNAEFKRDRAVSCRVCGRGTPGRFSGKHAPTAGRQGVRCDLRSSTSTPRNTGRFTQSAQKNDQLLMDQPILLILSFGAQCSRKVQWGHNVTRQSTIHLVF